MERIDYRPRNFLEGSQRPGEEPSYWRLFRGEKVSLDEIEQQGQLYGVAVEGMLTRGKAVLEVVNSNGKDTVLVYLQKGV